MAAFVCAYRDCTERRPHGHRADVAIIWWDWWPVNQATAPRERTT